MARYAKDYPAGPHDQPQSMCPAFGSLRVGLRMRRTATVLSGSACCVYGLTFTSHFYGARRTVGYVPFNSETLVTGKLFEDIREAVFKLADPDKYDAIVVINLCVPTASGVPLRLLPKEIDGVRIIGIDVPGFGVPTHAEAKDVLAGAMLNYARNEAEHGPVQAPRAPREDAPTITLLGEMFPADPVQIGGLAEAARASPPAPSCRRANGANSMPRSTAPPSRRSIRSTPPASASFEAAGRPIVGSAPVGVEGTAAWLDAIAAACNVEASKLDAAKSEHPAGDQGGARRSADQRPHHALGLRRLGAARRRGCWSRAAPTCAMSAPPARARPIREADRDWLEAKGVAVRLPRLARAGPRRAATNIAPDLAIGTTPVVQKAKKRAIPALYFTNLISARPLMGVAGAGSLAEDRQRRARRPRALRRDAHLLRRRRRGLCRRRLAARRRRTGPNSASEANARSSAIGEELGAC